MKNLFLFVFAVVICKLLISQPLEYSWLNPKPQGNNLYSVYFFDSSNGWAVGHAGTLLKTSDSGNSWETVETGIGKTLYDISFLNSDTGWIIGGNSIYQDDTGGIILRTTNGGNEWMIYSVDTIPVLSKIQFVNGNGWIVGDSGTIFKSTSGLDWVQQNCIVSGNLWGLFFLNESTGWITSNEGDILFTNNGGSEWQFQESSYEDGLRSPFFINENEGWINSDGLLCVGGILHTTNGGLNWEYNSYVENYGCGFDIYFIDSLHGFNVGLTSGYHNDLILETFDGGQNWEPHNTNNSTAFNSIYFTDDNNGYIVGNGGSMIKTMNQGSEWDKMFEGHTDGLYDMFFLDEDNGWILKSDSVMITKNAGVSWETYYLGNDNFHSAEYFINEQKGWVVGGNGTIAKTIDGGLTWESMEFLSNIDYNYVYFMNESTGWAGGSSGVFIKTTDGGETWEVISDIWGHIEDVNFHNNNLLTALTSNNAFNWSLIYNSIDGGLNWNVTDTIWNYAVTSASFINSYEGWMVGNAYNQSITPQNLAVFHTNDGGLSWDIINTFTKRCDFNFVLFTDSDNGWFGTDKGIFYTIDGGLSINSLAQITNNEIKDLTQTGDYLWAIGLNGTILKFYNPLTNIEQTRVNKEMTVVYPNPVKNIVTMEIKDLSGYNIYSISGKLYKSGKLQSGVSKLDITSLDTGIYILDLIDLNEKVKIIKQ